MARQRLVERSVQVEPRTRQLSNWALICEEMVDTTRSDDYYEQVVAELRRRGLADLEIDEMRDFAWRTAGWLNFEKMLWDWCTLDEADIQLAIELQHQAGEISAEERASMEALMAKYAGKSEPVAAGDVKKGRA